MAEKVLVQVLPFRAISIRDGNSTLAAQAGEELELDADTAKELAADGFVRLLRVKG